MITKEELESMDTPCQYIARKKIVCEVVKSHLELYTEVDRLQKEVGEREKVVVATRKLCSDIDNLVPTSQVQISFDAVKELLRRLKEAK